MEWNYEENRMREIIREELVSIIPRIELLFEANQKKALKGTPFQYLTKPEVIERLRISERTLYSWEEFGLPVKKVGRKKYYSISDLVEFLESNDYEE